jgi:hypothetical protein
LFHDVINARGGCAAFVARIDPDRVKERQLHDAIFRKEWGDLFAVWDYCETSSKSDFASFDLVRKREDWRSRSLPRFIGSQNEQLRSGRLWSKAVVNAGCPLQPSGRSRQRLKHVLALPC